MKWVVTAMLGLALTPGCQSHAWAYDASGDRQFPSTLLLPQIAPGDEFYINAFTLPQTNGATRESNLTATYMKTITDDFGFVVEETWTAIGRSGTGTAYGWQNFDGELKYRALNDIDHELILSLGLDRETGGTGATRVSASPSGATTPRLYFGKGLGDLDIGYLRPFAIEGFAGFQFADKVPRPDQTQSGFVVEYSIPYLQSKVHSFDLPDLIRGLTPMTEFLFTTPAGRSYGARATALIAPGVSYAGEGWEFAVEALLPQSRATGSGIGVTAQLHLALDFFFPDSPISKPMIRTP
ncbi:MAG TPA: hypothetical protein VM782_21925 [Stellaceae bacterium]|nr:hypothetical protein [Stellaceae bacterium]